MKKKIKDFLLEYIGTTEIIIMAIIVGAVLIFCVNKENKERERRRIIAELPAPPPLPEDMILSEEDNIDNELFKVMGISYEAYFVDTLCRYIGTEQKEGFITLQKKAPGYEKFITEEENFYMWVEPNKYFPIGELLHVHNIAMNEELIQFQFTIDSPTDLLTMLKSRVDSIQNMVKQK